MNVLDSIPFDILQTIIEELSLPALVSFASTRKSHAPVPAKAMYARIAQLHTGQHVSDRTRTHGPRSLPRVQAAR